MQQNKAMSVKERLLEFLKAEGISASEFSRKMNLSPAYLASMRKSMPEEKVERLTKIFPQINRDWLLYGEGEMYRDLSDSGINPHRLDRHTVPLIPAQAFAGRFSLDSETVMLYDCEMIYSPAPSAQCAIRVSGDSMEPKIESGTILFLQKIDNRAFIPWGSPLVLDTSNGSLVKMLYPCEDEEYFIAKSYNPDYPPFKVAKDCIYGIYRIVYRMMEGEVF